MTTSSEAILSEIRNLLAVIVCFLVIVSALKLAAFLLSLCRLCKDLDYQQCSNHSITTVEESAETGEVPVSLPRSYFETTDDDDDRNFENPSREDGNNIPLLQLQHKPQDAFLTTCRLTTGVIRHTVTAVSTSKEGRQLDFENIRRVDEAEAEKMNYVLHTSSSGGTSGDGGSESRNNLNKGSRNLSLERVLSSLNKRMKYLTYMNLVTSIALVLILGLLLYYICSSRKYKNTREVEHSKLSTRRRSDFAMSKATPVTKPQNISVITDSNCIEKKVDTFCEERNGYAISNQQKYVASGKNSIDMGYKSVCKKDISDECTCHLYDEAGFGTVWKYLNSAQHRMKFAQATPKPVEIQKERLFKDMRGIGTFAIDMETSI